MKKHHGKGARRPQTAQKMFREDVEIKKEPQSG
jgi:hypothetical protein